MENTSHPSKDSAVEYKPELWFASLVINSIINAISVWLLTSIAVYMIETGKFRRNKRKTLSDSLMMKLALAIAILIFPRFLTTYALLWVGYQPPNPNSDHACEALIDSSAITYCIALYPISVFLWLRQRSLYLQPSLRNIYTIPVQVISWGSIVFLTFAGVGITLVVTIPVDFESSLNGCSGKDGEDRQKVLRYILTGILAIGEILLLSLFIYPLHRHRQSKWSTKTGTKHVQTNSSLSEVCYSTTQFTSSNHLSNINTSAVNKKQQLIKKNQGKKSTRQGVKTKKRIFRAMRVSLICASACIVSDIFSLSLVTFFFPSSTLRSFKNSLHDINVLVNFLSVIFCFETYKQIFRALASLCDNTLKRPNAERESSQSQYSSKDFSKLDSSHF